MSVVVRARARLLVLVLGVVVVQFGLMPDLRILGVQPDLLALTGVAAGLAAGRVVGAEAGFAAGLFADMFHLTPFGLSALAFCAVGWAVGTLNERVSHTTWWIPPVIAAIGAGAGTTLFAGFGAVVGESRMLSTDLIRIVAVVAAVDAALGPAAIALARATVGPKTHATSP